MQKKTIKKVIEAKMVEWLDTITDKKLAEKVKSNLMVSGGCVASMFLNETVNDFDVYIKDIGVLKDLCLYYCEPVNLQVLDGRERDELIYEDYNKTKHNQYSVAIDTLKEDQIKIFIDSGRGGHRVENPEGKYTPVFFSPNAISLSDQLQIVVRFNGDDQAIHKNFDFIHATNYFTFEKGLVTNLAAMESLMTRQLVYQGSLYPLTSIIRVRKFIKRQWNIGAGELLKIMFQISELDLTDIKVLEEQLIGVDVAYFEALIAALRNKTDKEPNFKISGAYIGALIDKIFDNE